ncbi:hypothetical protein Tco_1032128 [Tanacetum coccineum]|uniref:Xylulose kinase-1 n=2 Tax=Tanacetum coccineum TaxID=301880 RepID=A0ABQ5GB00_9ASTR
MVGTPRYLRLVVYRQKVGDEAIHKELGDRMEMAATTASSLEAEQDSVNAVRHMLMLSVQVPAAEESDGLAEIIDFLKASSVHYALTVNPIIYTSCIEQFWATAKVQTVNGVRQLQALVDKKRVIITESSIRCDLHLEDAGGTDCLPTATIFEELARMGYEKPSQKLTFLKLSFLHSGTSEEVGEDSDHPTDSNQIPIVDQPSTSSQPKQKQKSKRRQRKEAEVAHDETEHEESVPTPSNDPLPSAKDAQAKETADLKKRIQRLERKKKSRTTGLRRLKKVGISRRVESSEDQ